MKILPLRPAPRSVSPMAVDFGANLQGPLGGEVQRIERQGSRWAVQVEMPPMKHPATGRIFMSRLVSGISEGLRMAFPLQGFNPGTPGSPMVDGAGHAGRTLPIKNATPGYVFREGQFFSLTRGDRHYLYKVDGEAVVGSDGKAVLPIWPMLRAQHLDGDALHVGRPMIEGLVTADQLGWQMALAHFSAFSFELRERG